MNVLNVVHIVMRSSSWYREFIDFLPVWAVYVGGSASTISGTWANTGMLWECLPLLFLLFACFFNGLCVLRSPPRLGGCRSRSAGAGAVYSPYKPVYEWFIGLAHNFVKLF